MFDVFFGELIPEMVIISKSKALSCHGPEKIGTLLLDQSLLDESSASVLFPKSKYDVHIYDHHDIS